MYFSAVNYSPSAVKLTAGQFIAMHCTNAPHKIQYSLEQKSMGHLNIVHHQMFNRPGVAGAVL